MSAEAVVGRARWGYPFQIAASASWRLVITMSLVVVVPAGAISLLFVVIGFPAIYPTLISAGALWFVCSYCVHEVGHSVTSWLVAGLLGGSRELYADGTFSRARIHRRSLGIHGDALVSIAGPLAAVVVGLPLLLPIWPFLLSFPFFCLFLIHLASLAPRSSDGAQLFASLRDRRDDAHSE